MSQSDTTVKKLQVVLTGNTAQLQQAMNQAQAATDKATGQIQSGLSKVDSAFKSIAKAAATYISVRTLVSFGKQCVELGSDLTEVQNVVDVTFGKMSSKIDEFSKSAIKQFGLSETAAKRYSSTMGAMLKSMGMSTDQAYEMSTTLTGLAGDIASFYNLSADEAFAKIRSGISGETEPLKQLGINLSVANLQSYALSQGITKSYNSMTQAEQALLRYNYLLTATADAQGDFSRTSDSWANQVKILRMNFESLKATLGQGLIYALLPAIKVINQLMERLKELAEEFKYFMAVLTGADYDAMEAATSSALTDDLATASEMAVSTSDSVDSISDSLKNASAEARKFLFAFDEIHALQGDDSSADTDAESAANSLALGLDNVDPISELVTADALNGLDEANNKLNDLNNGFNGLSDEKKKQIEETVEKVKDIVDKVEDAATPVVDAAKGTVQSAVGIGEIVGGITSHDMDKQSTGSIRLMEGQDNIKKSLGGLWAWVKEHIGGQKNATEDFQEEWAKESAIQRKYKTLSAIGYGGGDTDLAIWSHVFGNKDAYKDQRRKELAFEAWQYVTPEMEERWKNGQWTDDDNDYLTNKMFNPWNDKNYALWHYNQRVEANPDDVDAQIALEYLQDIAALWNELEAAESNRGTDYEEYTGAIADLSDSVADLKEYAEVNSGPNAYHGNVDVPDSFNDNNPVVPAPTIDEYKDACKEGIREALDERQPTNITIEMSGREVGYGVADAMAVENVQFNPEVAVV